MTVDWPTLVLGAVITVIAGLPAALVAWIANRTVKQLDQLENRFRNHENNVEIHFNSEATTLYRQLMDERLRGVDAELQDIKKWVQEVNRLLRDVRRLLGDRRIGESNIFSSLDNTD